MATYTFGEAYDPGTEDFGYTFSYTEGTKYPNASISAASDMSTACSDLADRDISFNAVTQYNGTTYKLGFLAVVPKTEYTLSQEVACTPCSLDIPTCSEGCTATCDGC